jgi:hypothetical protein
VSEEAVGAREVTRKTIALLEKRGAAK